MIEKITKLSTEIEQAEKELSIAREHMVEKVWMLGPIEWSVVATTRHGACNVSSNDAALWIGGRLATEAPGALLEALEGDLLAQLVCELGKRAQELETAVRRVRAAIATVEVDHHG